MPNSGLPCSYSLYCRENGIYGHQEHFQVEGGLQEKVGFSDDKLGRGFGGWQASLAKHVAVSATLTFATPQAAYAKVGWLYPPTVSLRPTSSTALLKSPFQADRWVLSLVTSA